MLPEPVGRMYRSKPINSKLHHIHKHILDRPDRLRTLVEQKVPDKLITIMLLLLMMNRLVVVVVVLDGKVAPSVPRSLAFSEEKNQNVCDIFDNERGESIRVMLTLLILFLPS
jgi:hypothetical protein